MWFLKIDGKVTGLQSVLPADTHCTYFIALWSLVAPKFPLLCVGREKVPKAGALCQCPASLGAAFLPPTCVSFMVWDSQHRVPFSPILRSLPSQRTLTSLPFPQYTVSPLYPHVPFLWIQPIADGKYLKKNPESSKKQDLNLLHQQIFTQHLYFITYYK